MQEQSRIKNNDNLHLDTKAGFRNGGCSHRYDKFCLQMPVSGAVRMAVDIKFDTQMWIWYCSTAGLNDSHCILIFIHLVAAIMLPELILTDS